LEPVLGPFKSSISIEALGAIFSPLERMDKLLYWIVEFMDPANQLHVLGELLRHKKKIKESPPEKVEELLDDEEWDISYWAIWRSNCNLKYAGWRTAYELYVSLPSECSALVNLYYRFIDSVAKINKRASKKFSYKFGDYLSDRAKTCTPDNWAKTVDECFMIGYNKALKCARKYLLRKVIKYLQLAIRVMVINKLEKSILDTVGEAIKPVQELIIPPIDLLINLDAMVSDVISGTIDNCLLELVGSIHPALAERIQIDANPGVPTTQGKTSV